MRIEVQSARRRHRSPSVSQPRLRSQQSRAGLWLRVMSVPMLVVVSGPPGSGKTTLAHALAGAIGCPAICRDEIKEGMVHAAAPGFVPATDDVLSQRTYTVFFEVLELLLRAGTTVVAEAAFKIGCGVRGSSSWRMWPMRSRIADARLRRARGSASGRSGLVRSWNRTGNGCGLLARRRKERRDGGLGRRWCADDRHAGNRLAVRDPSTSRGDFRYARHAQSGPSGRGGSPGGG
jgi:hypothetical protein